MSKSKKHNQMYITASEWAVEFGGKKEAKNRPTSFRGALPFYHCAFSLQPIQGDAVCTPDGRLFDIVNLLPYIQQHKSSPVTGEPLELKDIIHLKWHKNNEGVLHCPVTFKVFNDNTHIVAIRTTGNVFSYEAVHSLNIKLSNMKDLLTDEKFTKKDIITIQDPNNPKAIEMSEFHHLKNNIKVTNNDPLNNINANASTKRILAELNEKKQQRKAEGESVDEKKIIYTSATRGPNTKSSALTSTAMNVVTQERPEDVQRRETEQFKNLQYERIKKRKENAIVTLHTNMGDLNLELYPHWTPKTCDNFISLCERGYYDNTKFHRLIPGFMIQGGDPTGTGKGGESIFKKDFEDEFYQKLKHDSAGVLAMANRGKATNGSQFYITFGACNHLDMKHSIFGKLVGGMDVLREMEQVRTEADRPLTPIIILRTTILKNPYQEDAEEQKAKQNKETVGEKAEMGQWFSNPIEVKEGGIGKYLPKANVQEKKGTKRPVEEVPATETIRQETKKQKFNFSKW